MAKPSPAHQIATEAHTAAANDAVHALLCARELAKALPRLPLDGNTVALSFRLMAQEVMRKTGQMQQIQGVAEHERREDPRWVLIGLYANDIRVHAALLDGEDNDDGMVKHAEVAASLGRSIGLAAKKCIIAIDRTAFAVDPKYILWFESEEEASQPLEMEEIRVTKPRKKAAKAIAQDITKGLRKGAAHEKSGAMVATE